MRRQRADIPCRARSHECVLRCQRFYLGHFQGDRRTGTKHVIDFQWRAIDTHRGKSNLCTTRVARRARIVTNALSTAQDLDTRLDEMCERMNASEPSQRRRSFAALAKAPLAGLLFSATPALILTSHSRRLLREVEFRSLRRRGCRQLERQTTHRILGTCVSSVSENELSTAARHAFRIAVLRRADASRCTIVLASAPRSRSSNCTREASAPYPLMKTHTFRGMWASAMLRSHRIAHLKHCEPVPTRRSNLCSCCAWEAHRGNACCTAHLQSFAWVWYRANCTEQQTERAETVSGTNLFRGPTA